MKRNPNIFLVFFRISFLLIVLIGLFGCSLGFEWHDITPAEFQNGWGNIGGAYETAGYGKDNQGFVHLKGYVNDGSYYHSNTIFILPSGFRPNHTLVVSVYAGSTANASGYLYIYYDGSVALYAPSIPDHPAVSVTLDGIVFYVGQ